MGSKLESSETVNDEDDPITGVIGNSGKYQLLICVLIALFEVGSGFSIEIFIRGISKVLYLFSLRSFHYKITIDNNFSYPMLGV